MKNITYYNYFFYNIDELSYSKSFIHNLHPLTKLVTSLIYIIVISSFSKYEIVGLIPFILYPLFLILFSNIKSKFIIQKIILIEPIIIIFALLNIFFNEKYFIIFGFNIPSGIFVSLSIILKTTLSLSTAIILVATTGFYNIISSLQIMKVPGFFLLLILLIYRYISILLEEVYKLLMSYMLRTGNTKGIRKEYWGNIVGTLLKKTIIKSELIYKAMLIRGFNNKYYFNTNYRVNYRDILFVVIFNILFIILKVIFK